MGRSYPQVMRANGLHLRNKRLHLRNINRGKAVIILVTAKREGGILIKLKVQYYNFKLINNSVCKPSANTYVPKGLESFATINLVSCSTKENVKVVG